MKRANDGDAAPDARPVGDSAGGHHPASPTRMEADAGIFMRLQRAASIYRGSPGKAKVRE
jgi:hypothetical protein